MKNTEVEITFPLENPEEVKKRLESLGAISRGVKEQKDTYYVPPHRNFLAEKPITDWLRIRETPKGTTMNFKHWHNKENTQAVSCDEYETAVEKAEAAKTIFASLDITPIVVVDKKRSIFEYKSVEIAIDDVAELGSFIELEAKGDFASIEEAKRRLYAVLEELGAKTGEQDFRGYPHLLLEKQDKL